MQTLVEGTFGRLPVEEGRDHLEQLALVDRAAVQLEVDGHVGGDRRRGLECRDVLRRRVDGRDELAHVGEVRAPGCRRRWRRRRSSRAAVDCAAHLADPLRVVLGRDRSLDERQVVRALHRRAAAPRGSSDLDLAGEREQLVLAVEQGELAAVTRGELPDGERRLARPLTAPSPPAAAPARRTGVDRAVAADDRRAELAVAAVAERALHVPLQRDVRSASGTPRSSSASRREAHHDLGPADEGVRRRRVEPGAGDQLGHDADLAVPAALCAVHRDVDRELASATARARPGRAGRPGSGCRRAG